MEPVHPDEIEVAFGENEPIPEKCLDQPRSVYKVKFQTDWNRIHKRFSGKLAEVYHLQRMTVTNHTLTPTLVRVSRSLSFAASRGRSRPCLRILFFDWFDGLPWCRHT